VRRHIRLPDDAEVTVEPLSGFLRTYVWWADTSTINPDYRQLGGLIRREVGSNGSEVEDWTVTGDVFVPL
jgi:hypothetical protein